MKTITIQGKEYAPVVERVKEFLSSNKKGSIETEIAYEGGAEPSVRITVKATVKMDDGRTFTGHSQAAGAKGKMGKVALEVAETSAVGRALGFAGIGLIDGIASADEMRKAGVKAKVADDDKDEDADEIPF